MIKRLTIMLIFLSVLVFSGKAKGGVFTVNNPTEFQNALDSAESNGENDVIYVAPGKYELSSILTYSTSDGDGSLTIQAQDPDNPPVLDAGGTYPRGILFIGNDNDSDGGDENNDITIKGLIFVNGNYSGRGGGLCVNTGEANITIKDCIFIGNRANCGGGGMYAYSTSGTINIINCIFSGNRSRPGGGMWGHSDSGTISITNCTFWNNSAGLRDGDGGGIYICLINDRATANIYNNIIYNNTATKGGYDGDDLYVDSDLNGNGIGSFVNLCCNDMGENSDFESGHSEDLYITLTDHYSHDGNIKDDPQLVEPQCGNYHLKPNSPCIDAGICGIKLPWFYLRIAPDTDYEGDRRCPGEVTTGCCDIGADEFIKPMPWLHLLLGD